MDSNLKARVLNCLKDRFGGDQVRLQGEKPPFKAWIKDPQASMLFSIPGCQITKFKSHPEKRAVSFLVQPRQ